MNILFLSPPWAERADISRLVSEAGHVPILVDTSAQAETHAAQGGADIVLLDLSAGAEALRFLRKAAQQRVPLPVVAIADRRTPEASTEALRLGVADIIGRPLHPDKVVAAFANAREFSRLAERAPAYVELPQPADGVFGASPAMRDVLAIVRRVAQSRCSVLIVGERGTGRETIARAIRDQGPRGSVFMKVVCTDVDLSAFTAALDPAASQNATLYLEDLCELPMEMQLRLEARLLEGAENGPRVLGAPQPRIVDRVARGLFRATLLDAISVVRIDLPPLRQRAQDIPLLATHFLKEACKRQETAAKAFSRGALALLSALPWAGNGTELRGLTERLSILVPRGVVLLEDVLANVRFDGAQAIGSERGSLKRARERFERDYVTAVLQHHKGRMGAAAKELGIERTNLYRKIKQLKIQWTVSD